MYPGLTTYKKMKTLIYFLGKSGPALPTSPPLNLPITNPLYSALNNFFQTFLAKNRHDYKVDTVLQSLSLMCFSILWLDANFNYPNKALCLKLPHISLQFFIYIRKPYEVTESNTNQFSYYTLFCGSSRCEKREPIHVATI